MDLDFVITFFGWAALTYSWVNINVTFAEAIYQAIQKHNNAIRQEFLQVVEDEDTDSEPEQPRDES